MKNIILFKLQKRQMDGYEPCNNYFGFRKIEILAFNYDGRGSALTKEDGKISYASPEDLRFLFFGGWYKATINDTFNNEKIIVLKGNSTGISNLDKDCLLINLNNNPLLKHLLKSYITNEYQEAADFSEETIWAEYQYLLKHNELDKLFIQESLDNTYGL